MAGTVLIGYDTESGCVTEASYEPVKILQKSIAALTALHVKHGVPATFFIVGRTLEMGHKILRQLREYPDLFDIQQHTYSHVPLKSINPESDAASVANDTNVIGATIPRIKREVRKANELLAKYLDVECIGIRGPWGYYRGLADRQDVLRALAENGIRFASTYIRNEHDYFPLSLSVQPFAYVGQGFPGIVELPSQDWVDSVWRTVYGWGRIGAYARHVAGVISRVSKKDLVWGTCFHDWSVVTFDPGLRIMKGLIEQAREKEVSMMSYGQFFRVSGSTVG